MAMIIKLNRVVDTTPEEAGLDEMRQSQAAEVILFPGVRYERWTDRAIEPTQSSRGTREQTETARDWLDV